MATPTRTDIVAELQALQAGIQKNLPTFSFIVGAKTYSATEMLAVVGTVLASARAVLDAHAALADALQKDKTVRQQSGGTVKGLRDMIGLMYADNPVTLADFGMEARKPRATLSAEALLVRAAKSRSTREKRQTMGKRQRAAIKGEVTGVTITPVTSDGGPPGPAKTE